MVNYSNNEIIERKKRQTAYKINVKDIIESSFDNENDFFYAKTKIGPVSRVNIIGFVISKEINEFSSTLVIDDGSGRIATRFFDKKQNLENIELGDAVNVIGRIRMYGDQKYVAIEIIKKVNPLWVEYRKKELLILEDIYKKIELCEEEKKNLPPQFEEEVVENNSEIQIILDCIKKFDDGNGANISDIIKKSNCSDAERIIQELIKNGDVFEIMPGKIKILE
ncbi:MAG: OB-fold nucleic acid binding domain-containing protein [Candidatus Woesearchaeota archaeon]